MIGQLDFRNISDYVESHQRRSILVGYPEAYPMKCGTNTTPGILLLVSVLFPFEVYVSPPLFPQFQHFYGVSNSVFGSAFTGMMLVHAVSQFPAGVVTDRPADAGQ